MLGDPKNIQSWTEKLFIAICGTMLGLAQFFWGLLGITVVKHQATVYLGWFYVVMGATVIILAAPVFIGGITLYFKLPYRQLSNAIKMLFKSLPEII